MEIAYRLILVIFVPAKQLIIFSLICQHTKNVLKICYRKLSEDVEEYLLPVSVC